MGDHVSKDDFPGHYITERGHRTLRYKIKGHSGKLFFVVCLFLNKLSLVQLCFLRGVHSALKPGTGAGLGASRAGPPGAGALRTGEPRVRRPTGGHGAAFAGGGGASLTKTVPGADLCASSPGRVSRPTAGME